MAGNGKKLPATRAKTAPRKRGNQLPVGSNTPKGAAAVKAILASVASGEPAYKAARANGVKWPTFWFWLSKDDALADKYARAKQLGIARHCDDILQISDNPKIPPEHKRIMVDTRKWLLSKLIPDKYGDKTQMQHSGSIATNLIITDD